MVSPLCLDAAIMYALFFLRRKTEPGTRDDERKLRVPLASRAVLRHEFPGLLSGSSLVAETKEEEGGDEVGRGR